MFLGLQESSRRIRILFLLIKYIFLFNLRP